ncbi:MAG TPA: hypothetical protein DHV04_01905 [Flavobacteriaceae bacterium]|nr:hypothetical protein [Flavobacteriaceae bacterium]
MIKVGSCSGTDCHSPGGQYWCFEEPNQ